MQEGEHIDINGPTGEIKYLGNGSFNIEGSSHSFEKLNLVAGGSGVTPIWQLIHAILKRGDDKTQLSLIDSNKTYDDILLVNELEEYAQEHSDQFKLWHTLSKKPTDREWKYSEGHADLQMMKDHFFMPDSGGKVATFLCGPPGLIKKGAIPALQKLQVAGPQTSCTVITDAAFLQRLRGGKDDVWLLTIAGLESPDGHNGLYVRRELVGVRIYSLLHMHLPPSACAHLQPQTLI